jgi:hypothetical protein
MPTEVVTGPAGTPVTVTGNTRATQIAYYAQALGELTGTYAGNETSYDGLTWSAFYEKLANAYPSDDPLELANAVVGIAAAQHVAVSDVKSVLDATSNTATAVAKGANAYVTSLPSPPSNPLDALASIGSFFSTLTQANTWIRIAEVLLGVALTIVVLDELLKGTPAGDAVHTVSKTVGLAAVAA